LEPYEGCMASFWGNSNSLWSLALWDSYRPKITVSPGGTLNSKSPFGTFFNVQNQGALSIANIRYLTRLEPIPATANAPHVVSQEQNVTVIPQMRSLESYSLTIHYEGVQISSAAAQPIPTNQVAPIPTNQVAGAHFPIAALLLTFEVSYDPQWYWKRTETFHFTGIPDVDGNWQWLPTAHQSGNEQIIDTNLLQRIQPSPAPASTNVATQVHTN